MSIAYELETATRLVEHSNNFFYSNIFDRHFTAEYFPVNRQLYLSMGVASITRDQLEKLRQTLSQAFSLSGDTISSDEHTVNVMYPVHGSDFSVIDRIMESMANWAAEHNLNSGCFLCGTQNDIACREVGDLKTVMCLNCHNDVEEKFAEHTATLANQTIQARYGMKEEKLHPGKGIIIASIAAPILGFVWFFLGSILPFSVFFVPLCTALYFNALYEICKRIVKGFDLTCLIVLTLVGLLSLVGIILSMSILNFFVLLYLVLGLVVAIIARRRIET